MLAGAARARVGMPGTVRQRPVDLLAQHDARELVWKGQGPKRHHLISLRAQRRIQADGAPDEEAGGTGILKAAPHPCRKGLAARGRPTVDVEGHNVAPLNDLRAHALSLAAEHLVRSPLHGLRRDLVHAQVRHARDALLELRAGVGEGRAQAADDHELDEAAHAVTVGRGE